jgi:hypothetical protein
VAQNQDSLVGNLLRVIQHMTKFSIAKEKDDPDSKMDRDLLSSNFPGLAIPNDPDFSKKMREQSPEKDAGVSDAMAALLALAPSHK